MASHLSSPAPLEHIVAAHLQQFFADHEAAPSAGLYHRIMACMERPLLRAALTAADGNQRNAARILGIHRNTLRRRMQELGLSPDMPA